MPGAIENKVARDHWLIDLFLGLFALGFAIPGTLGQAFITVCVCWVMHLSNRVVMDGRLLAARRADEQAKRMAVAHAIQKKAEALKARQREASAKYFEMSEGAQSAEGA